MASALKCDRCKNYFDYDPSAKNNFIAFGHKDIIIGKNFPVKDICPDCMEQFMTWFENPDNNDAHGQWSECFTDTHHYSGICSVCGKASIKTLTESLYEYCPKCGARMDLKNDEEEQQNE